MVLCFPGWDDGGMFSRAWFCGSPLTVWLFHLNLERILAVIHLRMIYVHTVLLDNEGPIYTLYLIYFVLIHTMNN